MQGVDAWLTQGDRDPEFGLPDLMLAASWWGGLSYVFNVLELTGCRLCRRPPKLEVYNYKFMIF